MSLPAYFRWVVPVAAVGIVSVALLLDTGVFQRAPRPEAVFGSWSHDTSADAADMIAMEERLREQGATDDIIRSAQQSHAQQQPSRSSVAIVVTADELRITLPGAVESVVTPITFQPAKPDMVHVIASTGAIAASFRIRDPDHLEWQRESDYIPLRRSSTE